jgi:hypothetical protein
MSQETPSEKQPDCPYPAFEEVTIKQIERGRILSLDTLLTYLHYVRTKESQPPNSLSPSLARACEVVIKLLTKDFPMSNGLPPSDVFQVRDVQYLQSDLLIDLTSSNLDREDIASFQRVALWHGGITGLNEAHFEILALLAKNNHRRDVQITMGLERNKYLELKDRETLRPWPLIVSISIYAHLAKVYRIPLRLFIMPEVPESPSDFDQHYEAIYRYFHNLNRKTVLVTTLHDPFKPNKRLRMMAVGLSESDWDWADLEVLILSTSTRLLLREISRTYSNLMPEISYETEASNSTRLMKILTRRRNALPPFYSGLFLWEDL